VSGARIGVALFGPQGKGSFNEAGHAGAVRAQQAGHAVEIRWISQRGADERAAALADWCAQRLDLLVAHGGQGDLPVSAVAPQYPGTAFVVTQGSVINANTSSYEVLQEQSAFLAGVLASQWSGSGTVAHLSGEEVTPGLKGRAAYAHGVRSARPATTLLTTFCGNQHDPALAYDTAAAQVTKGADVIFAMIDGGRDGVSRACRDFGVRQIGNVLNWVERDPAVFLASAVADSSVCVEQAILDFTHGRWQPGQHRTFGLDQPEAVRLALHPAVPAELRSLLDTWAQRLLTGEVHPATTFQAQG
jgi:basic membrane protein A